MKGRKERGHREGAGVETETGNAVLHPKQHGTEQGKRKGRSRGLRKKMGRCD